MAVGPHPTHTIHATSSRATTTAPNKAGSGRPANPGGEPLSTEPAVNPAEGTPHAWIGDAPTRTGTGRVRPAS